MSRTLDITLSVVFGVLGAGLAVVLGFLGVFLAFVSDSCGTNACNTDQLTAGILVGTLLPAFVFVIALVVMVVRLVRHKRAFWVPLVGIVASLGAWALGAALAFTAVPGFA